MWQLFFIGIALVLVFEGVLPFLSPRLWRRTMAHMMMQQDQVIRSFGLVSMLLGLGLLYWVH
ncbi:MAG: DUF2065 domain-containing protein [Gammaproteobacteria bacterium]|nr:DUF2065 domain-containing protein [Gammaproteobacteria bacterium]